MKAEWEIFITTICIINLYLL